MLTILLYLVGLSLSAVAAFYSVTGLAHIFSGAFVPVIIMGAALEASKLVGASFLFRHWREIPRFLKTYITVGVVVLMLLTAIGVFGFLSRAYLSQQAPIAALTAELAGADRAVALAQEQYDRDAAALRESRTNTAATDVITRLTARDRLTGSSGAITVLRQQQAVQQQLQRTLTASMDALRSAEAERSTLQQSFAERTVDVGPLMFVAKAVYGTADVDTMDNAVQWLILLIMVAFDPMAIAILLAAQYRPAMGMQTTTPPSPVSTPPAPMNPPSVTQPMTPADPYDTPTAAEFSNDNHEPAFEIMVTPSPESAPADIPLEPHPTTAPSRTHWKINRRRTRTAPKRA